MPKRAWLINLTAALGACGPPTPPARPPATPRVTRPSRRGRTAATVRPRPGPQPAPASFITWGVTARSWRGQRGRRLRVACPAGGQAANLWGTDVYTDDSSICSAAVHAGRITRAAGGTVVIEIRPGQGSYPGSTRNGVTSRSWGAWQGSFVVLSGGPLPPRPRRTGGRSITWSTNATAWRTRIGKRFTLYCPPGGHDGSVWGSGLYTDDSSVCTAAVHAGQLSRRAGGTVTIEIQPAQSSYTGSAQNGIQSRSWATWHGSFIFVAPVP